MVIRKTRKNTFKNCLFCARLIRRFKQARRRLWKMKLIFWSLLSADRLISSVLSSACRGGSSKLIERGSYRVKGAYPMSRARATIMLEFINIRPVRRHFERESSFSVLFGPFLPLPFPSSPSEVGPLNPARGLGECCELPQRGLGRSPSRNRIWCILAIKSDLWWPLFRWFSSKSTDQIRCSLSSKRTRWPKFVSWCWSCWVFSINWH